MQGITVLTVDIPPIRLLITGIISPTIRTLLLILGTIHHLLLPTVPLLLQLSHPTLLTIENLIRHFPIILSVRHQGMKIIHPLTGDHRGNSISIIHIHPRTVLPHLLGVDTIPTLEAILLIRRILLLILTLILLRDQHHRHLPAALDHHQQPINLLHQHDPSNHG
jgi:hypothetical protein